jgi:hypothetical protein
VAAQFGCRAPLLMAENSVSDVQRRARAAKAVHIPVMENFSNRHFKSYD